MHVSFSGPLVIFSHGLHTANSLLDLHDGASHGCCEVCDAAAKLRYNGCLFAKPNRTLLLT